MKIKDWFFVVSVLFLAIAVDQATKIWALKIPEFWVGPLHFILVHNHGAMLGLFSELPQILRVVTLSTSGFFLLSIYCFLQYIIPIPVKSLRIGLSLLIGGIIGNVLDRTIYGYVIDFISFDIKIGSFSTHTPVWNLADMIQWVGYGLIVHALYKHGHLLWPDQNSRTIFWINRKFQFKYAAVFVSTGVFMTVISMVFTYTFLQVTLDELVSHNPVAADKFSRAFLMSYLFLGFAFAITLFTIAKILSHRIAGPVYAFERYLTEVLEGKGLTRSGQPLKLRAGDDFKHLEDLAEKVRERIIQWNSEKRIEVVEYSEEEREQMLEKTVSQTEVTRTITDIKKVDGSS